MVLGKPKEVETVDMLNGSLWSSVFRFAMPMAISGFLQLLFNAADLVVVGRFGLPNSLGAVGATSAISMFTVNFFMGFSIGVGVEISTGLGENNWKKVSRAVHTSMPLALTCGLFVTIVGICFCRPVLELLNTPADIIDRSALYLRIYFAGIPANLVYNYGAAILRADGDSKRPLKYLSIAGVLNVILNLIFVIWFKMDVAGVALATVITTCLSAFLTVRAISNLKDLCRLQFKYMGFFKEPLLHILKVGLPAGIQNATFSISNMVLQGAVNSFGTVTVDANSAAQSLQGFVFTIMNGFSQAAVNFAGKNFGAKQYDRITKSRNVCIAYQGVANIILALIVTFAGSSLAAIYIKDDPEAVALAVMRLKFTTYFSIFNGAVEVFSGCLRGMGYSTVPMLVSLFGICGTRMIMLLTVFNIPRFHTYVTVCATNPISWIITFVIIAIVYVNVTKKKFGEIATQ